MGSKTGTLTISTYPVLASFNIILVVAVATVAVVIVADLRWGLRWCKRWRLVKEVNISQLIVVAIRTDLS